jgi:transcriptional regulator with XRE-family HTH domain
MSRKKLPREKNTLGGRFAYAREQKGYDIKKLAVLMGCSPSHITGIELNKKSPSEYFLNDLEQKTYISKLFIKTGQGEPYIKKEVDTKQVASTEKAKGEAVFIQQETIQNFFQSFGLMLNHLDGRLKSIEDRITSLEGKKLEKAEEAIKEKKVLIELVARFGHIAVEKGYIELHDLIEALVTQVNENITQKNHHLIGEILVDQGKMTTSQVKDILKGKTALNILS